jgi:hypothetical protein
LSSVNHYNASLVTNPNNHSVAVDRTHAAAKEP